MRMLRLILSHCVVVILFTGCILLSPHMSAMEGLLSGLLSGAVSGILVRWARES